VPSFYTRTLSFLPDSASGKVRLGPLSPCTGDPLPVGTVVDPPHWSLSPTFVPLVLFRPGEVLPEISSDFNMFYAGPPLFSGLLALVGFSPAPRGFFWTLTLGSLLPPLANPASLW